MDVNDKRTRLFLIGEAVVGLQLRKGKGTDQGGRVVDSGCATSSKTRKNCNPFIPITSQSRVAYEPRRIRSQASARPWLRKGIVGLIIGFTT